MNELKDYYIYKRFISDLVRNQNTTSIPTFQDIYIGDKYERLFESVIKLVKEYPKASLTTLRILLFKYSGIKEMVGNFVHDSQITPGLILDFGTEINRETIVCGLKQEYIYEEEKYKYVPIPMEENTIFDLASTSKLFTALSILKLESMGLIDVYDPVAKYVPEYKNLEDVTIYDLLKFRVMIVTDKRVDQAKSKEEALEILRTVHKRDSQDFKNAYTDMGAMVLREVVEHVANCPFQEFVYSEIIKPAKMKDTYLRVPKEKISRVANENYSSIVDKNGIILTRMNNFPGIPHDPKAIAIGELEGVAPGHAGYFSTSADMIKLGQAIINGDIIPKQSVLSMSDTATGFKDEDGWTRFYGSLVYLKQPDPRNLSVYPPLSGKAFMSPGFAGTTLVVDPLNRITLFIGANRLHNRIYSVHPNQEKNIIVDEYSNRKTFIDQNGETKIVCSDFTKNKEVLVTKALDLALQLQLLERLRPKEKGLSLVRELN